MESVFNWLDCVMEQGAVVASRGVTRARPQRDDWRTTLSSGSLEPPCVLIPTQLADSGTTTIVV
jgi:hypothetical protein